MPDRQIDYIVIHCSATPNGRAHTAKDIDAWHIARGFRRKAPVGNPELKSIGYHYVIYTDGTIHTGRDISETGAHAAGFNAHSIGICMIGTDKFNAFQWDSLVKLIDELKKKYPGSEIRGHRELPDVHKECPGFSVKDWLKADMHGGLAGHILPL